MVSTGLSYQMLKQILAIQRTGIVHMNVDVTELIITLDFLDDSHTLNIIFDRINNDKLPGLKICWDKILRIPTLPPVLCGKNPNDKDICLHTCISAVQHNHLSCVKVLSRRPEHCPKLITNTINAAAKCGYIDILTYLMAHNKRTDIAVDGAFILSAKNGHLDVVKFFIETKLITSHFYKEWALQVAYENRHWEIVKYFIPNYWTIYKNATMCKAD